MTQAQTGGGRGGRDEGGGGMDDYVIRVYRCAAVVKGGRRFSFGALVAVGDRRGRVAIGYAKAREVPPAVEKAKKKASADLKRVNLVGSTIPHQVLGRYGASSVRLIPASEGTGVIAGESVRAILELAGVRDCLTKVYGSTNPKNVTKAVMNGLLRLRTREYVAQLRGVALVS
ncbi:MAG: 30S ribosomal protein S5 [Phycisphaerae bacterium]